MVLKGPKLFQNDSDPLQEANSIKTRFAKTGVEEHKHRALTSTSANST